MSRVAEHIPPVVLYPAERTFAVIRCGFAAAGVTKNPQTAHWTFT